MSADSTRALVAFRELRSQCCLFVIVVVVYHVDEGRRTRSMEKFWFIVYLYIFFHLGEDVS